ncbi:MAG: pyridoxamine kinase [Selenomonadaceae bacterium]|nr:pyridoxamine kinase [Selenomonadaceae bacterium]
MKQKKLALINDITGFGRCSVTVELPIISALKIQVCPLPTAILSVHTGYKNYFMDDFTDRMNAYIKSWRLNNLEFDGIATGFLGSAAQIEIVSNFLKNSNAQILIDPVMGDHGKIYASYTREMCIEMRKLLHFADLVTPNLTEACELLNIPYPADGIISDSDLATMAANIAAKTRGGQVVITGVNLDADDGSNITNFVYDNGKINFVTSKKLGSDRSGTGDVFFAIVAASIMNCEDLTAAVRKAADFVTKCILHAENLNLPWNYGLPFEEFLTELI